MEIIPIFPVTVSRSSIPTGKEFKELRKKVYELKNNVGNLGSVDSYILEDPQFSTVKKGLEERVNEHLREVYNPATYDVEDPLSLYITQSWVNITKESEFHHRHSHPNSVLSGVVYLQVAPTDSIRFFKPYKDLIIDFDREVYDLLNSSNWVFSGFEAGDLMVFPSTLEHEVPDRVNQASEDRISLAFNTFFKGEVGNTDMYTKLSL